MQVLVTRILGDCPGCGGIRKYGNVSVRKDHLLRGCLSCRYSKRVPLPPVHKKILYLDQFFFSRALQAQDLRFVEAVQRVRHISSCQLLATPFSSVHEDETHQWRGHSGKNKDDLMKFIKSTSRGHKFKPAYKVELTQIARAFRAFLSGAPPALELQHDDAIDDKIHAWDDYIRIDVDRYIVDIELMRDLKQQSVEALVGDTFENWRRSTNTYEEQVALEMREVAKGYVTTYAEYVARITSGDFDAVWKAPLLSKVFESLIHCLPLEKPEDRLKKIGQFFTSEHFKQVPHLWLTARIYATVKDMVKRGAYHSDTAKDRLSGFFQDIKHVATYAPYCDAFFMDKAMAHVVADPRINLGNRFDVKVFSLNNWDQFLSWLSDIEAGMSQEHRAALSSVYS